MSYWSHKEWKQEEREKEREREPILKVPTF